MKENVTVPKFLKILAFVLTLIGTLVAIWLTDWPCEIKAICTLGIVTVSLACYSFIAFIYIRNINNQHDSLKDNHKALANEYDRKAIQLERYKTIWGSFGNTLDALVVRKDAGRIDVLHRWYNNVSIRLDNAEDGGLDNDDF